MRIVMFYHSLLSDWNHGNAHFLRGVVSELLNRGHTVNVYEPRNSWSRTNLISEHGDAPLQEFQQIYPTLHSIQYDIDTLDLQKEILGSLPADLVIVHEWSEHALVKKMGELRKRSNAFTLLFHDTHHRAVT